MFLVDAQAWGAKYCIQMCAYDHQVPWCSYVDLEGWHVNMRAFEILWHPIAWDHAVVFVSICDCITGQFEILHTYADFAGASYENSIKGYVC